VWVDRVELQTLPPTPKQLPTPKTTASSGAATARAAVPGNKGAWVSGGRNREWWQVDWGYRREFGGVRLAWDRSHRGLDYDILASDDGRVYDTLRQVRNGAGGSVLVFTPESEGRIVRILLRGQVGRGPFRLEDLDLVPSESLATRNQYVEHIAGAAPRGRFPRSFLKEKTYWTVVGVPDDRSEALMNEDGMFEVDKQAFSLEPFVWLDRGKELLTWAEGREEQSLENGYMPIPTVRRVHATMIVGVTLLAAGEAGASTLVARYVVKNTSQNEERGSFALAIRPYQTNPPYQLLNFDGGASTISTIRFSAGSAEVDGRRVSVSGTPSMGASTIDGGEVVHHLAAGSLPRDQEVSDPARFASGAFRYAFSLAPGDSMIVVAAVPQGPSSPLADHQPTNQDFEDLLLRGRSTWYRRLGTLKWDIPPSARHLFNVVRSTLAYILINKDGPGIQPGSRSYERSWIRDGSMTSAALLKFGM
ncbi:MAG: discoidin domain-containing protein, partial [Bacteroidota bacterium]